MLIENAQPDEGDIGSEASRESQFAGSNVVLQARDWRFSCSIVIAFSRAG